MTSRPSPHPLRRRSLRRRLLSLMFAGFAVLVAINAALLWIYARGAADRSYDLLLAGAALSILERVSTGADGVSVDVPYSALEMVGLARADRAFYAVRLDGRVLTGERDLPLPEGYRPSSEPVFFDAPFSGEPVRVVVQSRRLVAASGAVWASVQLAQTRLARDEQARDLFLTGLAGLAALSIIGLLFVWFAIRRALAPLAAIQRDLAARGPSDLDPIAVDPPREVERLLRALNGFMGRLDAARGRSETFIADVAHQTRTGLSALQGQLSLAAGAGGEAELRERLARADAQARKVSRLTDQLLAQAMVTHRADHETMGPVALVPLARDLLTEMMRDTALRNVEIAFTVACSPGHDIVIGDPVSIREALRNLIENAVRHGPADNSVEVTVRTEGAQVCLIVEDAGPGVPEADRALVLERFRSHAPLTAGSGLGLSIVQAVATAHRATLELETSARRGLRALLRFPVALLLVVLLAHPFGEKARAQAISVWSATDIAAMAPVVEAFEAANPDVSVDYRELQTVDLHRRVLEGATPDVVVSPAMDLQVDLVNRGLARRLATPETAVPRWASWRRELFGFTREPAALIYNRAALDPGEVPRTHADLATFLRENEARLVGRVGTYDIERSGIGYLFATQDAVIGQEFARVTEAMGRARARTFCCTSAMLERVATGDLVFAVNVIGSYALAAAARDGRIGVAFFDDYNLAMARTAFVPRAARRPEAGERFVSFLVSPQGQRAIAQRSSLLPIAAAQTPDREVIPIPLTTGLLTFLDGIKRDRFLRNWRSSIGSRDG